MMWGFAIVNFATPDLVGHTGNRPAVVKAVETADACLGDVVAAVERDGGVTLVTADHGNAETMLEPGGQPHTAHTSNPVPFLVTVVGAEVRPKGALADLAPTVLGLLGIEQPEAMTGRSLVSPA